MPDTQIGREQFLRTIHNGISRYEQSGRVFMTGFLSLSERNLAIKAAGKLPFRLDGGRPNALRERFVLGLDDDQPVCSVLKAKLSRQAKELKHSDVLGALMHAGLKREAIGDIAVSADAVYLVVRSDLEDFIIQEIRQIGRTSLLFEVCDNEDMPPAAFEEMKVNVASLRADVMVAALSHCSRSDAKDKIAAGFVKVNDEILESNKTLCNNDTISVRRAGKYIIQDIDGVSRKGRLIVNILKYQ